jgi:hypothetical protein
MEKLLRMDQRMSLDVSVQLVTTRILQAGRLRTIESEDDVVSHTDMSAERMNRVRSDDTGQLT